MSSVKLNMAYTTISKMESDLAALREELATAKRANYNAEVALKAAYEVQELWKGRTTNLTHTNADLQQRLAAAEQRNANVERALSGLLFEFDDGVNGGSDEPVAALDYARTLIDAAEFQPTESGASE